MRAATGRRGESPRRRYHPVDFGDRQWARMVSFALERADRFQCAIPYQFVAQDLDRAPLWPDALMLLRSDIIDRYVSLIRWERLREHPTQIVTFRLTEAVVRLVRSVGPLTNWQWEHGAPEDPTFMDRDSTLLAACSLDGSIAIFLEESDVATLSDSGVRLIEPLGVAPEPWPTP